FLRFGTESVDDRAASRSVTVPTTPAAPLFAGRDLVKLDIEGSEAAVLEAARDEIRSSRPLLLLEVLDGTPRLRGVIADLLEDGYLLRSSDGARRTVTLDELAQGGNYDVLLVPAERDHA
ncbi:MAG: hypothetical protein QOE59_4646, partial [Actinomycetota bacterium]|nr:hypothetical protein [Actinomycetota bacterium]